MKKIFRLHNNISSSFFNLINGDNEVKQTKGLALLFSKSELALKSFLSINRIESIIGVIDWQSITKVIVNAEMTSDNDISYRADIVIRLYSNKIPVKIIIIEAKNAGIYISAKNAAIQLQNYINNSVFPELKEFKDDQIFGITLTKYHGSLSQKNIISITWSDIVENFYHINKTSDVLLNDYFNFITNINGAMKFYEEEVYSIPTADWSNEAINNFFVYECPNSGTYIIKKKPLYLAFRKSGGGEMDKLYKVEDLIILNFNTDFKDFMEDGNYSSEIRQKVNGYVSYMKSKKLWGDNLPEDEKQVFILSEKVINLPHNPKPPKNNTFRTYYTLSQLLDPNKPIV
jgi:hypothetical protein